MDQEARIEGMVEAGTESEAEQRVRSFLRSRLSTPHPVKDRASLMSVSITPEEMGCFAFVAIVVYRGEDSSSTAPEWLTNLCGKIPDGQIDRVA